MALSPEGNHVAFVGTRGGTRQIYVRTLNSPESQPIPGTEEAFCTPSFSPDGQWLVFYAEGRLKKVSLQGGPPVTLANTGGIFGVSWGPDDTIVFADPFIGGLQKVSAAGGVAQLITTVDANKGEASHSWPAHLPGGKALLFAIRKEGRPDDAQIVVQRLDTGERKVLVEGGTYPHYVPTGHLVFTRAGTLMAAPLDLDRLEIAGAPAAVAADIRQSGTGTAQYALSSRGSLVYVSGGEQGNANTLLWVDRNGMSQPLPGFRDEFYLWPDLSPDGHRLAVSGGGMAASDLWVYDIPRAALTRLTFDRTSSFPLWSPDGKWIAYSSILPGGASNLFRKPADGSGAAERLTESRNIQFPGSWSPDGKLLAFMETDPSTGLDIWLLPLEGDPSAGSGQGRRPQPFLRTPFLELMPVFSPDGRWLAYVSNESGREEVYAQPVPGPGQKWQISTAGGTQPVWARNGELFYRNGDQLMAVEIRTQPTFSASPPRLLFAGPYFWFIHRQNFDVTPDGQRFLMLKSQEVPATQVNVVLNWFEELRQRVPSGQ